MNHVKPIYVIFVFKVFKKGKEQDKEYTTGTMIR